MWYVAQDGEHARLRAEALQHLAVLRQARIDELETQLVTALRQHESVHELVSERIAAEEAERKAHDEKLLAMTRPLPEGLRIAIETVHDLLRRSGHAGLRFLSVRAITDKEMRGVELFETSPDATTVATLWQAERVAFHLDRNTSSLTIRLREGRVVRAGVARELPDAGEPLVLLGVDGPTFEERLPFLVVAEGAYPVPEPVMPPAARLDRFTAESWRERLNRLLEVSATPFRYRVTELEGLQDARFLGVVVLGQAEGRRIEQVIEVQRLAVVLDERAGTVELELVGGVFHRAGGDTDLPAAEPGQRVLLPGVTPQAASQILTGMVLER